MSFCSVRKNSSKGANFAGHRKYSLTEMKSYTELVILGILKDGPKHGYEIKKLLKNVLGVFTSFESTSIYYSLNRLEEKGCLKKKSARKELHPEKHVYSLTSKGKSLLTQLLSDNFLSLNRPFVNVDLSIYFLPYIEKEDLEKKVKIRVRALERIKRWLEKRISEFPQNSPVHLKIIFEHNLCLINAEISFTKDFLKSLLF